MSGVSAEPEEAKTAVGSHLQRSQNNRKSEQPTKIPTSSTAVLQYTRQNEDPQENKN
jgi:hypothetical protein